jgi:hypothetical protein
LSAHRAARAALDQAQRQLVARSRVIDSVLHAAYPGLLGRRDTAASLVAVIFDTDGGVLRHASRTGGAQSGALDALFRGLAVDTLSARTREVGVVARPKWHLNVMYAVEGAGPPHGAPTVSGRVEAR